MQNTYKDLRTRFFSQDKREVFAHFGWNSKCNETWETPFQKLAELAKPEKWNFQSDEFRADKRQFPILDSYLNHTFRRLLEQDKIVYSFDDTLAAFNTGLQTTSEKDIFALFYRNKSAQIRKQADWTLLMFVDSFSEKLNDFPVVPEIATYITDASDLVFDHSYDIQIDVDHIVDRNAGRLPETLQNNRTLAMSSIEGAMKLVRQRIQRNYKIAIPHWYAERIQLLLPLNLSDSTHADLALVADKDVERKLYRIRTALSMDMAYVDARLISRLDQEWLRP